MLHCEKKKQVLAELPHGEEFRFVDEVLELVPGESAIGIYALKGDEEFLRGHFPGEPIMPGVLMVEAIAQLGGIAAQCESSGKSTQVLRLTAVNQAKILGTVGPGEKLRLEAKVEGRLAGLILISGAVYIQEQGEKIASAKVTLSGAE